MTNITADDAAAYAADAAVDIGDENILASISRVARELREAQDDVAKAEETLSQAQDRVRTISEGTLPDLMDKAHQTKLTTMDGFVLERGETIRASIPPANLPRGAMWLEANGQGDLVKTEVSMKFGRGEKQKAAEAVSILVGSHFAPSEKLSVHPMSLAAAVRELIERGVDVPKELLGVYVQPWVKLRRPGERKAVKGTGKG